LNSGKVFPLDATEASETAAESTHRAA
jgi:hypothetical protein